MSDMLNKAQQSFSAYDDGDVIEPSKEKNGESLWSHPDFVKALINKAEQNPQFQVRLLFNDPADTLGVIEAVKERGLKNVDIRKRAPNDRTAPLCRETYTSSSLMGGQTSTFLSTRKVILGGTIKFFMCGTHNAATAAICTNNCRVLIVCLKNLYHC